jgi:ATP-dependent helicase HrpA
MPEDSPEWQAARRQWERSGITSWDFEELPEAVQVGHFLVGYLGLAPSERAVSIRLFRDKEEARASHERGVEALLAAKFAKDADFLRRYLLIPEEHVKAAMYFGGKPALERRMQEKVRAELFRRNFRTLREHEAHASTLNRAMAETGHKLQEITGRILDAYRQTRDVLQSVRKPASSNRALGALVQEARAELDRLVPADFMEIYPLEVLKELSRYISAIWVRVQRGKNDPEKDKKKADEVQPFVEVLAKLEKEAAKAPPDFRRAVEELRGMLEEFKVSVFAPELKTAYPVSAKRLARKIKDIIDLRRV